MTADQQTDFPEHVPGKIVGVETKEEVGYFISDGFKWHGPYSRETVERIYS